MSEQVEKQQGQNDIKQRLHNLRASLLERKKRVDSDLQRESGPLPADFSEQATAVENDEALIAIQGELQLQLNQIQHALQRVESGEYGLCEGCNQNISSARLNAIPSTSLCISCASISAP